MNIAHYVIEMEELDAWLVKYVVFRFSEYWLFYMPVEFDSVVTRQNK